MEILKITFREQGNMTDYFKEQGNIVSHLTLVLLIPDRLPLQTV